MKRLLILTSHPIQYNAPFFKLLTQRNRIIVKVLYTIGETGGNHFDKGFKQSVDWDIPLLEGYDYEFVQNISLKPGSYHFFGIINRGLKEKITHYQPDAILVYGWSFFSHLLTMISFKGKYKIFFRGDSTMLDEVNSNYIKRILRKFILKQVYKFIDIALFVGLQNKLYFQSNGVSSKKLIFSPHSIDNLRFFDQKNLFQDRINEWKQNLKITDKLVFIFIGKYESKKNPAILINAFKKITTHNVALLMVGSGEQEKALKELSKYNDNIIFIPFQNQSYMPIVYRLGDVLVLPSSGPGETWGLVVNEAFACGLPAIVSDKVGCFSDLINPKVTGWVFENGKQDDLFHCMEEAISLGKEGLKEMGSYSRSLIQNWNFEENAKILEEPMNLIK